VKVWRGVPLPDICLQQPAPLDDAGREALVTLERHVVHDVLFAPDPEPERYWETHDDGQMNATEVGDLMHSGDEVPIVSLTTSFNDTLLEISGKRLGVTAVVDDGGTLAGIITDGDLRRALAKMPDIRGARATDLMTPQPKTIAATVLAEQAVATMERHSITSLVVVDDTTQQPLGIIHLHDLLKAGVV